MIPTAGQYATGADVEVYLTDGPDRPPTWDPRSRLDVVGVSIVQEGNVIPLFDFADYLAKHFAYATRLVTGSLQFNVSSDYIHRFKQHGVLQDKTLWIVMTTVRWEPNTAVVRDTIRINHFWGHPWQHEPAPSATEYVPFSARVLELVERTVGVIDFDLMQPLFQAEGGAEIARSDFFKAKTTTLLGEVVAPKTRPSAAAIEGVVDADTIWVRPVGERTPLSIRLIGADAPETPKSSLELKGNEDNDPLWRWPAGAPTQVPESNGTGGASPTKAQLDGWGLHAKQVVRDMVIAAGYQVRLISNIGTKPVDEFDRYLYDIEIGGVSLTEYLIEAGLAVPFFTAAVEQTSSGTYTSSLARWRQLYETARSKAGQEGAQGIWASFEPPS